MYKIINVKDFQTCNNNMSVAEPRNQADEVLSKCTSMRTTTVPFLSFDSPGKVAEFNADNRSIYDVYGHDNDIYKKMGGVETCMEQKVSPLAHTVQIQ